MYADRIHRSTISPAALTAALAINGGVLAALLLAAPEIIQRDPVDIIEATNIPIPPEPAPVEKPIEKTVQIPAEIIPIVPEPKIIVPTDPRIDTLTIDTTPRDDAGGSADPGVAVDPPKQPAPMLVDAAPDPRYARDFQPGYPPSELRAGREGKVTVRVLIGADGRVKAVEPVRSDAAAFLEATRRQALSRWRFTPATRDGIPVEAWRTMTVRFELNT